MICNFQSIYILQYIARCVRVLLSYLLFLCLIEAQQYVDLLQTEGVNIPVDQDVDSHSMQLPEWYDEKLFKR